MATATLKESIRDLIARELSMANDGAAVDMDHIRDDTDLMYGGVGFTSITAMTLVTRIEKEFGITIDNTDYSMENMNTVDGLAGLVERYRA